MRGTLYKVLNTDGACFHGGIGKWPLPHDGEPGEWMPAVKGRLVACENGYHLCREKDLLEWLGPLIGIAEWQGERLDADNKVAVRGPVRIVVVFDTWNERTQRLFACDCADHVLPLYEKEHPNARRVRDCIATARRYANGEASSEDLAAARSAARAAAWAAARAAARDARTAASSAARAARDAAWAAAWDAAAWAAARDARDARDAAWAAAWAAEKKWQTERLMQYLSGEVA